MLHPDQQQHLYKEDLADREQQASSLAAAGLVAESVNYTQASVIGQVLQAPPPLVGMAPPSQVPGAPGGGAHGQIEMEGINWNELGGNMDDMDMDFAAMFDPEQEQAFLQDPVINFPDPASGSNVPDPTSSSGTNDGGGGGGTNPVNTTA